VSRWVSSKSKQDDEILAQYLLHLNVSDFSRQQFVEQYENYNSEAIGYFKGDPSRLLVLDLEDDSKLDKLRLFLKPKKNATIYPCENSYFSRAKAT
jgi:hypothetical protein